MADLGAIGGTLDRYDVARLDGPQSRPVKSLHSISNNPIMPAPPFTTKALDRIWRSVGTPPWWGSRPIGALPLPNFVLDGYVYQRDDADLDTPVLTRVAIYYRRNMGLIAVTRTRADGYFRFDTLMPEMGQYFAIALDPEGAPDQNALIYDKLSPRSM